ncbi:MAG TPA: nitroreductase, partial [Erysipelotrichaceae bacterium]|nr:nitroreductase [Erysipelotrichaceae bacterium]
RSGFTKEGVAENDAGNGWGYYDNGLAHMCLMLGAVEKGLNTLVMGIRDADILRTNFNIPEDELITSVIALGYQDIDPTMPKRKNVEDIVKIL